MSFNFAKTPFSNAVLSNSFCNSVMSSIVYSPISSHNLSYGLMSLFFNISSINLFLLSSSDRKSFAYFISSGILLSLIFLPSISLSIRFLYSSNTFEIRSLSDIGISAVSGSSVFSSGSLPPRTRFVVCRARLFVLLCFLLCLDIRRAFFVFLFILS